MKPLTLRQRFKDIDKFIELVNLLKAWFATEEMEIDDFVLGRMAKRLLDREEATKQEWDLELKDNIGQLRQWLNEKPQGLVTNKDLKTWLVKSNKKS